MLALFQQENKKESKLNVVTTKLFRLFALMFLGAFPYIAGFAILNNINTVALFFPQNSLMFLFILASATFSIITGLLTLMNSGEFTWAICVVIKPFKLVERYEAWKQKRYNSRKI